MIGVKVLIKGSTERESLSTSYKSDRRLTGLLTNRKTRRLSLGMAAEAATEDNYHNQMFRHRPYVVGTVSDQFAMRR